MKVESRSVHSATSLVSRAGLAFATRTGPANAFRGDSGNRESIRIDLTHEELCERVSERGLLIPEAVRHEGNPDDSIPPPLPRVVDARDALGGAVGDRHRAPIEGAGPIIALFPRP